MKWGVNLRTKLIALVVLLCCLFTFAAAEGQTAQTVETLYVTAASAYTLPVYAGEPVVTETALSLPLHSV